MHGVAPAKKLEIPCDKDVREIILDALYSGESDRDPDGWRVGEDQCGEGQHGTPCLLISDVHWAEVVNPTEVRNTNEYDVAKARARLHQLTRRTINLTHKVVSGGGQYDRIVVPLLGDMVSGTIHDELAQTNELTAFRAIYTLADEIICMIDSFKEAYGSVYLPCVVGNHGRLDKKPRAKQGTETNFDWALYEYLRRYYIRDENVLVDVPDGFTCRFSIEGTHFLASHGDNMKGGSGITGPLVPWAIGTSRQLRQAHSIYQHVPGADVPHDVQLFGHWHQYHSMNNMIANGSVKGFDEFAMKCGFNYEVPQQALFWVTEKRGITLRCAVDCRTDEETPE